MTPTTAEATTTRVAMITGGNRGLGLAALRSENIYASAIQVDINGAPSIAGAVDRVTREHGRLDILADNRLVEGAR